VGVTLAVTLLTVPATSDGPVPLFEEQQAIHAAATTAVKLRTTDFAIFVIVVSPACLSRLDRA
jgi:hypothetical protein